MNLPLDPVPLVQVPQAVRPVPGAVPEAARRLEGGAAAPPYPERSAAGCCGTRHDPVLTRRLGAGQVLAGAAKLGAVLLKVGLAAPADVAARRAICAACPHSRAECPVAWVAGVADDGAGLGCCALCRCYLGAKTQRAAERCPDSPPRWGEP
jgi:hypothetical protein